MLIYMFLSRLAVIRAVGSHNAQPGGSERAAAREALSEWLSVTEGLILDEQMGMGWV